MRCFWSLLCILFFVFCNNRADVYQKEIIISIRQGQTDYSDLLQKAFDKKPRKIIFEAGEYSFRNVSIKSNVRIESKGNVIFRPILVPNSYEKTELNMFQSMFSSKDVDSISINGVKFIGRTSNQILKSDYKSSRYYSRPLVQIDNAQYVSVENCLFSDVEGCTYSNKNFTYYGNKKGILLSCYDVNDLWIRNNEITGCRHDEQIWSIVVNKERKDLTVHFDNNYIHDETPTVNSSVFSCVAGRVYLSNNIVERFHYKGSIFNLFGEVVKIDNNTVVDSYATSVFDTGEYGYFFADSVFVRHNTISAINSQMVATMADYIECFDNHYEGLTLIAAENLPSASRSRYKYFYQKEKPKYANSQVIIKNNHCDFTHFDPLLDIILPDKYGYGIFLSPYYNKGKYVIIKGNTFNSFCVDEKKEGFPIGSNTIKIVNMNDIVISDNVFYGSWYHPNSKVYTTPIVVETEPRVFPLSLNSKELFESIHSVTVSCNTFERQSPNSTIISINRRLINKALRIGKVDISDNNGIVGGPMLYNSFANEIVYDGFNNETVALPCRTIKSKRQLLKGSNAINNITKGERLENGFFIRLKDGSEWRSTNVVPSFNPLDAEMKSISSDEMLFQGVYWIKIK